MYVSLKTFGVKFAFCAELQNCKKSGPLRVRLSTEKNKKKKKKKLLTVRVGLFSLREKAPTKNTKFNTVKLYHNRNFHSKVTHISYSYQSLIHYASATSFFRKNLKNNFISRHFLISEIKCYCKSLKFLGLRLKRSRKS